jgi:hypothetical protein
LRHTFKKTYENNSQTLSKEDIERNLFKNTEKYINSKIY